MKKMENMSKKELVAYLSEYTDKPKKAANYILDKDIDVNPNNICRLALETMRKEDVNHHGDSSTGVMHDLYLTRNPISDFFVSKLGQQYDLSNKYLFDCFTDNVTGKPSYCFAFCWKPEVAEI